MGDDDFPQHGEAVAAEVVTGLDQAVVETVQGRHQRHHHEQERRVDEADHDRRVVVQHLHRAGGQPRPLQEAADDAGFAQQDHPAESAHQLADPERDQAE